MWWVFRLLGGVASVGVFLFVALIATLWYFQRHLIFPRALGPAQTMPVRRGQLIKIDVSREVKPKGAPDVIVAAYFPAPSSDGNGGRPWTLAFWHGNADQIGNVGDVLGFELRKALSVGFLAIEYPGYALCSHGEPTERTILWTARRALTYATQELGVPKDRLCAFGQSIGTSVAAAVAADGLAARLVMLSPFTSIPDVCKAVFPFVPRPGLFILDKFDTAALAPRLVARAVPTLILHGNRDEIVPFAHGKTLAALLASSSSSDVNDDDRGDDTRDKKPQTTRFVELHTGHNDTFSGLGFRRFVEELARFLKTP